MSETIDMLPADDALWRKLASQFNEYGVASDEDEAWLTQAGIREHWPEIESKLRGLGYTGGELVRHAFSRQEEGWLTIIYDTSRFDVPREAERAWEGLSEVRWKKRIAEQADNWICRLKRLKSQTQEWIQATSSASLVLADRRPVQMREELMVRFGVPSRDMPSFEIQRGNRAVLRFQPKGLWIIGGNGRVDLIAAAKSFILVDMSEKLSKVSDWQVYATGPTKVVSPFTREFLMKLVND